MKILKLILDDLYVLLEYSLKYHNLTSIKPNIELKDNFFILIFPDYIEFINSGRKPHSKMPPSDAIIGWCRSKGISTDDNTIWKIRQGIARNGISPRPILDMFFELSEHEWETEWAEKVFDEIIEEIIIWFK